MKVFRTVTVQELIETLQEEDPESMVAFASDFGDHCHTQQVHSIKGVVEEIGLYQTAYSESGWAEKKTLPGEEEEPAAEGTPKVLVIR